MFNYGPEFKLDWIDNSNKNMKKVSKAIKVKE